MTLISTFFNTLFLLSLITLLVS